jgi:ComF family protein
MKTELRTAGKYLLHVLLPRVCANCLEDLHFLYDWPLCPACRGALEPLTGLCCRRCGGPLADGGEFCFGCRGRKSSAAKAELVRSAFTFSPGLRALVHAFKYRGRKDLSEPLGLEMVRAYDGRPELKNYPFALPVPLFPEKERGRGFNQSSLLAGVLARERKLFVLEDTARRIRDTPSQTGLSKEKRHENVKDAFVVSRPEMVKGRRILIIDDIATTLSTVEELATALKAAGAAGVAVFTLAREPLSRIPRPGSGKDEG